MTTHDHPRRTRMTRRERREQLIAVGRHIFATRGFDAVSVEEVAQAAGVTKPVIYEHFGGKEGIYQVIVDRETTALNELLEKTITPQIRPREALEGAVLALLDYIEVNPDGFRLLIHQSPTGLTSGADFSPIISDMGDHLTELLITYLGTLGFNVNAIPLYAQMLAGMVGITGQRWARTHQPTKTILAAHMVNLVWNGLHGLEREPHLTQENYSQAAESTD